MPAQARAVRRAFDRPEEPGLCSEGGVGGHPDPVTRSLSRARTLAAGAAARYPCRGRSRRTAVRREIPEGVQFLGFRCRKGGIRHLTGRLAQLGEHQLDKLGVTGSSPVPPTSRKPARGAGFRFSGPSASDNGVGPAWPLFGHFGSVRRPLGVVSPTSLDTFRVGWRGPGSADHAFAVFQETGLRGWSLSSSTLTVTRRDAHASPNGVTSRARTDDDLGERGVVVSGLVHGYGADAELVGSDATPDRHEGRPMARSVQPNETAR